MPKRKEEPFVVSDKRKFTAEGELRPDVEAPASEDVTEPQAEPAPTAANLESSSPPNVAESIEASTEPPEEAGDEKMPPPPTAAEQKAQHDEYHDAGKKLDSMLDAAGAQRPADQEMSFERLTASLYMQAMMQLGMLREENMPPPDLIAARQVRPSIRLVFQKVMRFRGEDRSSDFGTFSPLAEGQLGQPGTADPDAESGSGPHTLIGCSDSRMGCATAQSLSYRSNSW